MIYNISRRTSINHNVYESKKLIGIKQVYYPQKDSVPISNRKQNKGENWAVWLIKCNFSQHQILVLYFHLLHVWSPSHRPPSPIFNRLTQNAVLSPILLASNRSSSYAVLAGLCSTHLNLFLKHHTSQIYKRRAKIFRPSKLWRRSCRKINVYFPKLQISGYLKKMRLPILKKNRRWRNNDCVCFPRDSFHSSAQAWERRARNRRYDTALHYVILFQDTKPVPLRIIFNQYRGRLMDRQAINFRYLIGLRSANCRCNIIRSNIMAT